MVLSTIWRKENALSVFSSGFLHKVLPRNTMAPQCFQPLYRQPRSEVSLPCCKNVIATNTGLLTEGSSLDNRLRCQRCKDTLWCIPGMIFLRRALLQQVGGRTQTQTPPYSETIPEKLNHVGWVSLLDLLKDLAANYRKDRRSRKLSTQKSLLEVKGFGAHCA